MYNDIKQKIDEIKRVPLAEFCIRNLGYKPNQKHDSRLWRSLEAPNGCRIITKSKPNNNGHYLFRTADQSMQGVQGTIIDLLLKLHGYTMRQVLSEFCGPQLQTYTPPTIPPSLPEKDEDNTCIVKKYIEAHDLETSFNNYYTKRGICKKTLDFFGVKATSQSAILPLYRLVEGKWRAQTALKYYFDKKGHRKQFLEGLKKRGGFSLLKPINTSLLGHSKLYMFESPIDALSYCQLHNKPCALYLSLCGAITADFRGTAVTTLETLGIREVVLCLDNDKGGKNMTSILEYLLRPHFNLEVHKPKKKDWNAYFLIS